MTKELEEEYLEDLDHYDEGMGIHSTSYKKCKERLVRLAKIDSASPSEALECLEEIGFVPLNECCGSPYTRISDEYEEDYNTIKQALLKAQEQEKENTRAFGKDIIILNKTLKQTIDKPIFYVGRTGNKYIVPQELFENQTQELAKYKKAWEVVKEKRIDLPYLRCCFEDKQNVERYNEYIRNKTFDYDHEEELTQEEFDLLKEVLYNEQNK